tara:strand:+ start:1419 stop:1541 length:123 start_codon:yes stop_codon:yes gene_type:complete
MMTASLLSSALEEVEVTTGSGSDLARVLYQILPSVPSPHQ